MASDQHSDRTPQQRFGKFLVYITVGMVALLLVAGAFLALVLGTNWIADTAGSIYWSLPDLGRAAVSYAVMVLAAAFIGWMLVGRGPDHDD